MSNENPESIPPSNNVQIQTSAIEKPVVLIIGPESAGKTVLLARLARYLNRESHGYDVSANESFIYDPTGKHKRDLEAFDFIMHDTTSRIPRATEGDAYLLLDVRKGDELYCQILEAPGEHYWTKREENQNTLKPYQATILKGKQPIIFAFLFEHNMLPNKNERDNYDRRVSNLLNHFNADRKDQFIIIYNKIDTAHKLKIAGKKPNEQQAINELKSKFPNLINQIETICQNNRRKRYFTIFSSGEFTENQWVQGEPYYPERLWETLKDSIDPKLPLPLIIGGILAFAAIIVLAFVII